MRLEIKPKRPVLPWTLKSTILVKQRSPNQSPVVKAAKRTVLPQILRTTTLANIPSPDSSPVATVASKRTQNPQEKRHIGIIYVWIRGLVRSSLSVQKQLALWKSSVLPFLYHGIDNDKVAVPDGKDVVTVSAMEMDAKGAEVRLEESERGRFWFR